MTLKAVLFDFNGVIINDEAIHQQLLEQLLVEENLHPKIDEFRQICLGRSDRACLRELLTRRGRVVSEDLLDALIKRKSQAYHRTIANLEKLPIYPGLNDFIYKLRTAQVKLAVVSGAVRSEIEMVLERTKLAPYFSVIVAGDEGIASKPSPDGYLTAIDRLQEVFPDLGLQAAECLVIEDTFAGIESAKRAGIPVVGVANSYPFHMMHRHANWVVDYLNDLELDYIQQILAQLTPAQVANST